MANSKLHIFREKHPRFSYDRFSYTIADGELHAEFFYTLEPGITLRTQLIIFEMPVPNNLQVVENWLLNIGMIEGFSYWKAACPSDYVIRAGYFSPEQLLFWQSLIEKGMSEFYYVNQINGWETNFVRFVVEATPQKDRVDHETHLDRVLIPVGGGKDSAVGMELLKPSGIEIATLTVNENARVRSVLDASQIGTQVKVTRIQDPQILKLNAQGYLNGHTPFSASLSFISTLCAYIFNYRYVALSNEWSANEGNTVFLGQTINHQYSKTIEYEQYFQEYCRMYLSEQITFFSFLRPLHELQIAQYFSYYPQYFNAFLSCNRGAKNGVWCGECPKCLFVFTMLSAFLAPTVVTGIFGQNLFEKGTLLQTLNELSGATECKSFECVGTRDEMVIALFLCIQQYQGQPLPTLLTYAQKHILKENEDYAGKTEAFLSGFQHSNCMPELFVAYWKKIRA